MRPQLFNIPLLGSGTADVESFPSYLFRAAYEHGVFVGEFLRFIDVQSRRRGIIEEADPELPHSPAPNYLVRPNRVVHMLTKALGELARVDLKSSTLWFMEDNLGRSKDEVIKGFRWCPECFLEMALSGHERYYKLIWHLKALDCCPIHGTPFSDRCSECSSRQESYRMGHPIGTCHRCQADLSKREAPIDPTHIKPSWERHGADIVKLFQDIAERDSSCFPEAGARLSIQRIFDHFWRSDRELDLYRMVPRDQIISIVHGEGPVSLKVARRFAYRLGVDLFTLMSGEAHRTTAILDSDWVCAVSPDFMNVQSKSKHDHRRLHRRLVRALQRNDEVPPTLRQLAEEVGASVGYLRYRYPTIVTKVARRRHEYTEQVRLKKQYRAQEAALVYFLDERYSRVNISRKSAYRALREETNLPKFVLKAAISRAYLAIYGEE